MYVDELILDFTGLFTCGIMAKVNMNYQKELAVIDEQPPSTKSTKDTASTENPSYMTFSILTCLFCNWIGGAVPIVLSYLSQKESQLGNSSAARRKGRYALYANFACIIFAILFWIVLMILIACIG